MTFRVLRWLGGTVVAIASFALMFMGGLIVGRAILVVGHIFVKAEVIYVTAPALAVLIAGYLGSRAVIKADRRMMKLFLVCAAVAMTGVSCTGALLGNKFNSVNVLDITGTVIGCVLMWACLLRKPLKSGDLSVL